MGLCASTDHDGGNQAGYAEDNTSTKQANSSPVQAAVEVEQVEIVPKKAEVEDTEANFKFVFKSVAVVILDRLSFALTCERYAYQKIAEEMGDKNYMELMLYSEWKTLLSELYATSEYTSPGLEGDIRANHEDFILFLKSLKDPTCLLKLDKEALVERVQELVVRVQNKLTKAKELAKSSDLKMHCIFFINCMETLRGDVLTTKGQLYRQVDKFSHGQIGSA